MSRLFVDTAGWYALADADDPAHTAACSVRDAHLVRRGVFVSTDYVVDETLTLLRARMSLDVAEAWWEQVSSSRSVGWETVDTPRATAARAWFFRWRDKDFSFTDCTSFAVMKDLRIRRVLTTDHHFAQAGFDVVPEMR